MKMNLKLTVLKLFRLAIEAIVCEVDLGRYGHLFAVELMLWLIEEVGELVVMLYVDRMSLSSR